jgi:integrase/recombinase XerD
MQVNITKRIDTPEGKRYCPVVIGPNGRIKPDSVMVDGRQEKHPEGAYYLDWTEDGKRSRVSVGSDATAAYNCRVRKQRELDALASGLIVSNPIEDDSRLRIGSAVEDFLEEIQLSRQRKTWMGYIVSLRYFQESCGKRFLDEVERKDLLRFAAFLRDTKKLSPRTVHNKFADVLTFLQAQGVPKLIGKNDHPRFIEQEVSIYEEEELSKLHAVCSPYHSTLYDFLLMSGFREQEAMHVT